MALTRRIALPTEVLVRWYVSMSVMRTPAVRWRC
jgi:hypothetical protein